MTRIGHYEILSVLGDGGMGTVYKARDPRFDRTVAVKVLHPQLARDADVVQRFNRDLKPTNVLVETWDGEEHVKVLDFGIAKILGAEKARTATGATLGTLAYMSPEHIRSPKLVDARSDIYAVGVILFELLAGRTPFDADTEYDLMRAIVEVPPPDLRLLNASVPVALTKVVMRALEKSPGARFQSCEEMRAALRAAVSAPFSDGRAPVGTATAFLASPRLEEPPRAHAIDDGATTSRYADSQQPDGRADQSPIETLLDHAFQALDQGEAVQARALFDEVLRRDPDNLDAISGMAGLPASVPSLSDTLRRQRSAVRQGRRSN